MSEWIEHDGKGAPDLPPGTLVSIRCRDGFDDSIMPPRHFDFYLPDDKDPANYWLHGHPEDRMDEIVAYKVVTP